MSALKQSWGVILASGLAWAAEPGAAASGSSAETTGVERLLDEVRETRTAGNQTERMALIMYLTDQSDFETPVAEEVRRWIEDEPVAWLRSSLLNVLVERDEKEDAAFILGFLQDDDPRARLLAAGFAADHLTSEAAARLAGLLEREPMWWVRAAVVEALGSAD